MPLLAALIVAGAAAAPAPAQSPCYGFSNDARAWLGAPSFQAGSFPYDGRSLEPTISLHY
jgi:uncharacterized protein (DUF2141 family)